MPGLLAEEPHRAVLVAVDDTEARRGAGVGLLRGRGGGCASGGATGGQGGGAGGTHARAPHSLLHPLPPLATQADMGSNDYIFTLDADPKRDAANVRGRAAEGECVWGGGMLVRSFVFGVLSLGACPSRPAARPPSPGRPTRK